MGVAVSRVAAALLFAVLLAVRGYRKKSLSASGGAAAVVVGVVCLSASLRFGGVMLAFYFTSSRVTKVSEDVKARLEYGHVAGGQRNHVQVLASSLLATLVVCAHVLAVGADSFDVCASHPPGSLAHTSSALWVMYLAHYACANGDTWASELGVLSSHAPRLITSLCMRTVPAGTNGGVTLLGTAASAAGGLVIGLTFYLISAIASLASSAPSQCPQHPVLTLCLISGLAGSVFDSVLGATCQASYYSPEHKAIVRDPSAVTERLELVCGADLLSNEAVNFLSIGLTMLFALAVAPVVLL